MTQTITVIRGDGIGPEVTAAAVGVPRIVLERDEMATGSERPSQPDRAVAPERADLENLPRAMNLRKKVQRLP